LGGDIIETWKMYFSKVLVSGYKFLRCSIPEIIIYIVSAIVCILCSDWTEMTTLLEGKKRKKEGGV